MNANNSILLLSLGAGLSTCIGFFVLFLPINKTEKTVNFCLLLCASVMITVSLTELLAEATSHATAIFQGIFPYFFVVVLIVLITSIFFFIFRDNKARDYKKIGLISFIGVILHNFPEGIVTFMSGSVDYNMGIQIALAIALHNIPEGIAIAIPVYKGTNSKLKAFGYTLVAGLAEPLGALLAMQMLKEYITPLILSIAFILCASVMLYLSFKELLPQALKDSPKIILTPIMIGIIIIYLTGYIFG